MKMVLILNRDAGTLRGADPDAVAEEIAGIFRTHGHQVRVEIASGGAAIDAIRKACAADTAEVVVVGGGDGTVSAAAAAASECGIALGILPLGTMNFFARSLEIPLGNIKEAAESLAAGEIAKVDIATVNGRTFIHALALGLHPALVQEREKQEYHSRYGKMLGSVRAWLRVIREGRRFDVALDVNGRRVAHRTAGIVVSNNPLGEGHMPYADELEDGLLGIYVTTARGWLQLVRVTASAALGTVADNPWVEVYEAPRVEIGFSRHGVPATVDGELLTLTSPLKVESRRNALRVLRPRPAAPQAAGEAR